MATNSTNTTITTTTDIDSIWNSLKNEDTNDSCSGNLSEGRNKQYRLEDLI